MIKLFNEHLPNRASSIFEDVSGILNWDDVRSKVYLTLWNQMKENFWVPEEISMSQDAQQWSNFMSDAEKRTYRLAIGQLAVLDSIATNYDYILSTVIKDPAVKANLSFLTMIESIHNYSYTYCLTSLTNSAEILEIFEAPKKLDLMLKRNKLVIDVYEEFANNPTRENTLRSMVANMLLEGTFFVSGFSYFYHLSRNNKMNGTQTMISLIQRDEVAHRMLNSYIIRDIVTENPELNTKEFTDWVIELFKKAVDAEKAWCDFLYKETIGVNMKEMHGYIEYIASYSLDLLGIESPFEHKKTNPMRWISVYDSERSNNMKVDFFEGRVISYAKVSEEKNDWNDL